MSALSQNRRLINIDTPIGQDAFIVESLDGYEGVSTLFNFSLTLLSDNTSVNPKDLLGHNVSVSLQTDNSSEKRLINAHVSQFQALGVDENGLRKYHIVLVPSLWFTTLGSKNRIFHKANVEAIIKKVLGDYSKQIKFSFKAKGSFIEREYCVQYQETDFDFLSRLLAEEGISYYFTHTQKQHELVFVNSTQGFFDIGVEPLKHVGASTHGREDAILDWKRGYSYLTGGYAFTDYNEFTPNKDNAQKQSSSLKLFGGNDFNLTDHGLYQYEIDNDKKHKFVDNVNKTFTQQALEAVESTYDIGWGISNCNQFVAGGRFKLEHPTKGESGEYLITHLRIYSKDGNSVDSVLSNSFECVPASIIVRPKHTEFKRSILAPQVAKVVETCATAASNSQDLYTQVKVQFPWNTEQNSCWIRVVQQFAGNNWGGSFVPRVGQEVVINYIDGNPDRPLVIGAVYNGNNSSPNYTSTQSGWKTAVDGSKFNELRFDDKKGEEEIYMEAGKNHNWLVHNDQVGKVENDQTLTIENNRTTTINKGDDQLSVKKGHQNIEISAGNYNLKVAKGSSTTDVMKAITITSKTSIELKVGANSIKIDQSGIEIKGTMIKSKASALSELSAGGMMTVKGAITKIN